MTTSDIGGAIIEPSKGNKNPRKTERKYNTMNEKAKKVYELIQAKASSNEFVQGLTGVLGFPFTLLGDVGTIFTHYGPMMNEIRNVYGRQPASSEVIRPIFESCRTELFTDILVDKIVGQIPVIGIAANIMCAKTMTWRMGLLFALMALQGEDFQTENAAEAMRKIRLSFPQSAMFTFATPSIDAVDALLAEM